MAQAACPSDGATPFRAGPVNPANPADPAYNGFASYLQDSEGLALELCLTGDGSATGAPTNVCFYDPADAGNPFSVQVGFGPEAFWWLAGADVPTDVGRAVLVLGAEAAWAAEIPVDGQQFPFTRLRIRVDVPGAGTYTATHPFGQRQFVVTAADLDPDTGEGFINESLDIPFIPDAVNQGRVGPWLTWDTFDPATQTLSDLPGLIGFIGDAATPHAVTGSPCGTNVFRVEGPNIGGTGNNVVETTLFTVQGQIFPGAVQTPLGVDSVSYSRSAEDAVHLNIFATAPTTATVTCDVCDHPVRGNALATDTQGRFFTSQVLAALPSSVEVSATNTAPNNLPASVSGIVPQDIVTITRAEYATATQTLTIEANSSDRSTTAAPPLILSYGSTALTPGVPTDIGVALAPASVTVTSNRGGAATRPVTVINP